MSIIPHKDFRIMFQNDFDTVETAKYLCEEDQSCLYDLIKYIYYNTNDINIKGNIEWAMSKCHETQFLQDTKHAYFNIPYSALLLRGAST